MKAPEKVCRTLAQGLGCAASQIAAMLFLLDATESQPGIPALWASSWWFITLVMLAFAAALLMALGLLLMGIRHGELGGALGMLARNFAYGLALGLLAAALLVALGLLTGSVTGPIIDAQQSAFRTGQ